MIFLKLYKSIQDFSEGVTFRQFVEMTNEPAIEKASIPIPVECVKIAEALKKKDSDEVYAVGGCVRDHLFGKTPKDIDLATNLTYDEIIERAKEAGFRVMEKNSDTFGVAFIHTDSGEDEATEVAPFRSDDGISDGRRPDAVTFGVGIKEDAKRRDFTMNNLYYDFGYGKFGKNVIIDFNENGQGIKDIKDGVVRPVGDPMERFIEDRLRILRLMRFFSRFNDGDVESFLDQETVDAVQKLGKLRSPISINGKELQPIASERIQDEFMKGLQQARNPAQYISNYSKLNLLDSVFPALKIDLSKLNTLKNTRNSDVILAMLLKENKNVKNSLIGLSYSRNQAERIEFLIDALSLNDKNALKMVQNRDKIINRTVVNDKIKIKPEELSATLSQDLQELGRLTNNPELLQAIKHIAAYNLPKIDTSELKKDFKGPAMGAEIKRQREDHYKKSLEDFQNSNSNSKTPSSDVNDRLS
jgi:tRNA nucleotidyltransferase/poly(A) polymerase